MITVCMYACGDNHYYMKNQYTATKAVWLILILLMLLIVWRTYIQKIVTFKDKSTSTVTSTTILLSKDTSAAIEFMIPNVLKDISERIQLIWLDADNTPRNHNLQTKLKEQFPNAVFIYQAPKCTGVVDLYIRTSTKKVLYQYIRPGGYLMDVLNDLEVDPNENALYRLPDNNANVSWWRRKGCYKMDNNINTVGEELQVQKHSCVLINYATESHRPMQLRHNRYVRDEVRPDYIISLGPEDVDADFRKAFRHIMDQARGAGYWLWKPLIISNVLATCNAELVIYCDASTRLDAHMTGRHMVNECHNNRRSILAFHNPGNWWEVAWTKRDVFEAFGVKGKDTTEEKAIVDSEQIVATVSAYYRQQQQQNKHIALQFAQRWLHYGTQHELITDAGNRGGKSNFKGFAENRHDQSLFSLLCKTEFKSHVLNVPIQFSHHHFG